MAGGWGAQVNEELKQYFRPEFLNRLDEIIVFRQLNKNEVRQIAEIMLKDVFKRLTEKDITIDVTDRFKDRLVRAAGPPVRRPRSVSLLSLLPPPQHLPLPNPRAGAAPVFLPSSLPHFRTRSCSPAHWPRIPPPPPLLRRSALGAARHPAAAVGALYAGWCVAACWAKVTGLKHGRPVVPFPGG